MKRFLIIGAVAGAMMLMLVVGLALGVAVTPVRAQIGSVLSQALHSRASLLPRLQAQATQVPQLTLKAETGVLVGGVYTGSPADTAGLVRGDIILKVDDQAVNTSADLKGILANHKSGDTVALQVQHGDQQKTVSVTLADPVRVGKTAPQASATPPAENNQPAPSAQGAPFLGILPVGVGEGHTRVGKPGSGQPGTMIMQVAAGSPAEKAGLKVGEQITAVDGTAIDGQNSLSALITAHKPGDSVKLTVTGTDGTSREVTAALGENPQNQGQAYLGVSVGMNRGNDFDMPGMPGAPNGGQGNGMPFWHNAIPGLMGHQGALISQVTAGSPAEKAGLKAGQLIEAVDGQKIAGQTALSDALAGHKPGDSVTLSVFDGTAGKATEVKVTLGDNPQKAGSAWLGISYGYFNPQPGQKTGGTNL